MSTNTIFVEIHGLLALSFEGDVRIESDHFLRVLSWLIQDHLNVAINLNAQLISWELTLVLSNENDEERYSVAEFFAIIFHLPNVGVMDIERIW